MALGTIPEGIPDICTQTLETDINHRCSKCSWVVNTQSWDTGRVCPLTMRLTPHTSHLSMLKARSIFCPTPAVFSSVFV